ncbi:bifunctional folylpolyglutamate synthase/dihydrofolate synthase [Clostridium thermosuccinogenes]|uniref:bifunctional folylpolyglutamate synthase/dihydrofolate synthase n=1 Tax=Clostridium thermosuccinogenes TaxID=84032 RepID=UPI000CCC22ED|nr:folylpolyglutamate synthase/dihydrofolate synthase family protein [Pseudoclostridium thermosuccinogenes]PNT94126.1 bifunctional folylpolyglutamate synthase/dihydrofolate synthase [Pseudoclostridium thermosuccinogenes]
MEYNEALSYIHNTLKFGVKLGLNNITSLLELMGNPHKKLKFVHVAGTNGKGSTVAFISRVLMEAGYKTGMYTSPYIERFTERMKINDEEISEEELSRITQFVKEKVDIMLARGENHPTEFEIVTAIAFQYFYENDCDIVVLEVGLGGRFDSTNVIDTPLVSVITTISYDHMDRLGDTLPKIAFEKAGIIKHDGDVVLYPQTAEVEKVFQDVCLERGARLHRADFSALKPESFDISGQTFSYKSYKNLKISMLGDHQVNNAAVVLEVMELLKDKGYKISENAIRKGLLNTHWPGRLEVLKRDPLFLIDGAHNIEGARALRDALNRYFPDKKKIFIIGVLRDKDYKAVIETVVPIASHFITVTPNSDRALPAAELGGFIKSYCKNVTISDTIKEAVCTSMKICSPDSMICAFGSLYYIGEVRRLLKNNM